MKPFKTQAHIHSLAGQMDEITVLKELGNNSYLVDYRGVKCSAILIPSTAPTTQTTSMGGSKNENYLLLLQLDGNALPVLQRRERRLYRPRLCILLSSGSNTAIPPRIRIAAQTHPRHQTLLRRSTQWLKSQNSKCISDMNSLPEVTPARITSPSRQSTSTT